MSFVRRDRIGAAGLPRGFWTGPPDLAVEVSPGDRRSDIAEKIDEYLSTGVAAVWIVDPRMKTITVPRRMVPPVTLSP